MKKNLIKGLMLITAAVLLVVATVMGTMAYLTSSSAVSNTFTVGNVGIHMYETKVTTDGVPVEPRERVDGNSYHLVPGATYVKDPTIYVQANSDQSYLFVKVRNDIRSVEAPHSDTYKTMIEQAASNNWVYIGSTSNANVYVYNTYVGGVPVEKSYNVFSQFKIKDNADLTLVGGAKVTLTAFAIQKKGFEPTGNQTFAEAALSVWENQIAELYEYEDCDIITYPTN